MREQKQMKTWAKYRQEGEKKYVQKRSLLMAAAITIGQSTVMLLRSDLTVLLLLSLSFIFAMSYIGARIGTTFVWKRNEEKYNTQENNIEE